MAHEDNIPVQMNILKAIFSDHWSRFLKENKDKMRPVIIEEVEKVFTLWRVIKWVFDI